MRLNVKHLLVAASLVILAFVLVPQLGELGDAVNALENANWVYVAGAMTSALLSYLFAAVSYQVLTIKHITFYKTLIVQMGSAFANKLAPSGLGGVALNTRFFTTQKHTLAQSGSIVAVNSIMGFVAHVSLIIMLIVFTDASVTNTTSLVSVPWFVWLLVGSVLAAILGAIFFVPAIHTRVVTSYKHVKEALSEYHKKPMRLVGCYFASVTITMTYVVALFLSAQAIGVELSFAQSLIVFTLGSLAAAATPTPGGLGGAEAGLAASLVLTGMGTSDALVVTLLFRLVTFWLPIAPGFIAFQVSLRNKYI